MFCLVPLSSILISFESNKTESFDFELISTFPSKMFSMFGRRRGPPIMSSYLKSFTFDDSID